MLFMVSCSGGPLAGKAVATAPESDCPLIRDNAHLFTSSEAITMNNRQEDIVLRQGSPITVAVGGNHIIAQKGYLVKNCQNPQEISLSPTADSAAQGGWITTKKIESGVATTTISIDQSFEAGKRHYFFVFGCQWIEAGEDAEENPAGWDCHGDDDNPSKWMMTSFTVESCTDGVKNGDETDVDCGGTCGSNCIQGKRCQLATDCQQPLSCGVNNQCTSFCSDGKLNPSETDIDCGGSCGATCLTGKSCQQNTDCQQGLQCNVQKQCAISPPLPQAPPPVAQPAPPAAAPVAAPVVKVAQKRLPRFWAVGSSSDEQKIYYSEDGGKKWKVQYAAKERGSLQDITFPDKKVGYAVGPQGKILKTPDAGTTWVAQNSGTTVGLFGIDCVDHTRCWVVGEKGTILFTADGGTNWIAQNSGIERTFEEVFFIDESQGWVVGVQGYAENKILHTIDGGITWEMQKTEISSHFYDIQCIDQNCWVVGSGVKANMIQTIDGGATWTLVTVPSKEKLNAVQFVTFTTGYTAGFQVAFKTMDGGYTWQPLPSDKRWNFNDLFFIDENIGCGAGNTGGRSGRIFCTSDGGKTWTQFGEGTGMYFFYGITGRS